MWVILDPEIAFWAYFKRAYGTPLYSQKGVPSSSSTDFAAIVNELSAAGTFPLAAPVRSGEHRPPLTLVRVSLVSIALIVINYVLSYSSLQNRNQEILLEGH